MKQPVALACRAALLVTLSAAVMASEPPPKVRETVRVTWVRPARLPIRRRAALTRLLVAVVEGRTGSLTFRDSRPVTHPAPPSDGERLQAEALKGIRMKR